MEDYDPRKKMKSPVLITGRKQTVQVTVWVGFFWVKNKTSNYDNKFNY